MAEYWWTRVQFPPPPPLFLYTDNMKKVFKWIGLSVTPTHQPWGGFMAIFKDPDGNTFYLDQPNVVHSGD